MAIGVYKITNLINGKFYIGSSRRLSQREKEHNYNLRKSGSNTIIKSAVLKYGYENFKFEILDEFIFDKFATAAYIDELITSREQYYVDTLNPAYNIRKKDVTRNKGIGYINGERIEIPLSIREKKRLFPKNYGRKSIDVYNAATLEFIETINGVRKCAEKYKIDSKTISYHCKHGYVSPLICKFLFCSHATNINTIIKDRKNPKKYVKTKTNFIIQVDKMGEFIKEWRTMQEAEISLNLCKGSISRVISGEYSHTNGYYFKYK